jgi:hypothetical protein
MMEKHRRRHKSQPDLPPKCDLIDNDADATNPSRLGIRHVAETTRLNPIFKSSP